MDFSNGLKECGHKSPATEAHADKHDFIEVEHTVLPRHNNSFLQKLPVADHHIDLYKGEGRLTRGRRTTCIYEENETPTTTHRRTLEAEANERTATMSKT
jgi:hypothetical protein